MAKKKKKPKKKETPVLHFTCSEMTRNCVVCKCIYQDGWWPLNDFGFLPGSLCPVSPYDLCVSGVCAWKFFCFSMCLPIAVAPCSLRVLFAAPFKERLKAHLICKAPQFHKNPTQPPYIPEQTAAILPLILRSPSWLNWHVYWDCRPWGEEFHTFTAALAEPSGDFRQVQEGRIIIFLCFH